ncbi:hypothetical protein AgCh_024796 [Apium graveolens]
MMTSDKQNNGVITTNGVVNNDELGVILGLDGGTTSTICVCIPFSDHLSDPVPVLARAVAGCSNHNSVGETAARDTLVQVMTEALLKSGSKKSAVRAVCLGVSGVNHPDDQERILIWLRNIFPSHVKLYVQNDAVAALASGTMGKLHGCVLIAGTGTISYGFTEGGLEARAAGAGPVLGDWGSGYGIAAKALTAVIRAHDGRDSQTMLTDRILQSLGLPSPDELIGWTYADQSWARIAALVPVVVSCAEAGDEIAHQILNDAVQELASSVIAVVKRLGLGGEGITLNLYNICTGVFVLQGKYKMSIFWSASSCTVDMKFELKFKSSMMSVLLQNIRKHHVLKTYHLLCWPLEYYKLNSHL